MVCVIICSCDKAEAEYLLIETAPSVKPGNAGVGVVVLVCSLSCEIKMAKGVSVTLVAQSSTAIPGSLDHFPPSFLTMEAKEREPGNNQYSGDDVT